MKRKIMKFAVLLCAALEIGGCSSRSQTSMEESLQSDSIQQITDTIASEDRNDSDSGAKDKETKISSDSNMKENIEIHTDDRVSETDDSKKQIQELIHIIFTAYFTGDLHTIEQYADLQADTDLQTYPDKTGVNNVPQYKIKGLEELGDIEDGKTYTIWCEFKMHADDDFYQYLTINTIRRNNEWKIQSLGLEM